MLSTMRVKKDKCTVDLYVSQRSFVMANCSNCGFELPAGAVYCPKCGTSVPKTNEVPVSPLSPAAAVTQGPVLATWGERFVAWLIDFLIVSAVAWVIRSLAGLGSVGLFPGVPNWVPFLNMGLTEVFLFFYWMVMESAYGKSFGKMVMQLKVTRLDGSTPSIMQSALQSVGKAFILWLDVILAWFVFAKKRQRAFNRLSGTIVVRGK